MNLQPTRSREIEDQSNGVSRREVTRAMVGGGVMAAILGFGVRSDARAQGTPETTDGGPARYQLASGDVEIVFLPENEGGKAQLEYRDAATSITFSGDDLTYETSLALGRFVSVVTEQVDDGYELYLTLLVPDVNPSESGSDVEISSVAILTKHMTSIGGPRLVIGALQRYEVVDLTGVAQFAG